MQVGGTQHRPEPLREPFVGGGGGRSLVASKSQSGCSGEVQGRRVNLHRHYLEAVLGAGTKLVSR